ncbi:MAG TPA: glycosyltransferase family 2 protein [Niabella sp.]|nr:glycosyltransferase family 2 protein [Niabella sp.]
MEKLNIEIVNHPFISVIIPVFNEERYIKDCLDSVFSTDYPADMFEVIVVDGNSQDKTMEIVSSYKKVRLFSNPKKIVPVSMNLGIKNAIGEYIIRLDAHAAYPANYFSALIQNSLNLNADNVGAIWQTDVKNKTPVSLAIKEVLSNKYGVGNALFRIGVDKITEVDTVPFGCYRKDVFSRFGLYDERLVRNQDIELNKRIKARGGKIYLIPDIYCTYYARETYSALMKYNYNNGLWNILTVYYTKSWDSLSPRHFIPFAFVSAIFIGFILSVIRLKFIFVPIAIIFMYLLCLTIVYISKLRKKNLNYIKLLKAFIYLHFSYGVGSLVGICRALKMKVTELWS